MFVITVSAIGSNSHILALKKVPMEFVSVTTKCVTETERSVPYRPSREIVRSVLQRLVKDSVKNSKLAIEDSTASVPISSVLKD